MERTVGRDNEGQRDFALRSDSTNYEVKIGGVFVGPPRAQSRKYRRKKDAGGVDPCGNGDERERILGEPLSPGAKSSRRNFSPHFYN